MQTDRWRQRLSGVVADLGMDAAVTGLTPLSGGSISKAWKVDTAAGELLVKIGDMPLCAKEAEGLREIAATGAIPVPQVYGFGTVAADDADEADEREPLGYIAMTFVQGDEAPDTAERLGRGVAALHAVRGDRFGFRGDNYIGRLPQPNGWCGDWVEFLRDRRLGYQLGIAVERGRMPAGRRMRMERLLTRLERWIPADAAPSLLHGDLWSGNWVVGPGGQPYLIDPAVSYGDAEMELAFTELFGGFPDRFYDAYREMRPFDRQAYAERRPLYQLYYLLVHLNHFGESYGPAVDRVLARYVE